MEGLDSVWNRDWQREKGSISGGEDTTGQVCFGKLVSKGKQGSESVLQNKSESPRSEDISILPPKVPSRKETTLFYTNRRGCS